MREEDNLENTIKEIETEITNLKQVQFAGSSNVKIQDTVSGNTWDLDQNITFTAGFNDGSGNAYIIFIADTQKAPFAEFRYKILIDNVQIDPLSLPSWIALLTVSTTARYIPTLSEEENERAAFLSVYLARNPVAGFPFSFNLKIKAEVSANDSGTITSAYIQ